VRAFPNYLFVVSQFCGVPEFPIAFPLALGLCKSRSTEAQLAASLSVALFSVFTKEDEDRRVVHAMLRSQPSAAS
jgi:hypothetical protein